MSLLLERQVQVHQFCVAALAAPADDSAPVGATNDAAGPEADPNALTPPFLPALRRRWKNLRILNPQRHWSSPARASEEGSHDGGRSGWIDDAANFVPTATSDWEPGKPSPGDGVNDDDDGNYSESAQPHSPDSSVTGSSDDSVVAPIGSMLGNNATAAPHDEWLHWNDTTASTGWINVDVPGVRWHRYRRSSSSARSQHRSARPPTALPASRTIRTAFRDSWENGDAGVAHRRRPGWSQGAVTEDEDGTVCSVRIDPASLVRLVALSSNALYFAGLATLGSLRLLAPLLVARRVLNALGELLMDWYRGYYLRTTYESMQLQYYHYIQGPAILRSVGRLASQIGLFFVLGRIMEWMVGLSHAPCVILHDDHLSPPRALGGCHWWCGVLWLVAVVGTGHAGAAAIAVWGGPLRIQIVQSSTTWGGDGGGGGHGPAASSATSNNGIRRPSARHIFTRPFRMLKWLRDPDRWIRAIATNSLNQQRRRMRQYYSNYASTEPLRPFQPDPLLFPATWEPLRLLLFLGLAREMTSSRRTMLVLMRQILVQQSFADEWYRVLLCEKRIAIGIFVMVGFLFSSLNLFWTVLVRTGDPGSDAGLSIALLLPYLFSVIVSGYMNVFFYSDIRRIKKQEAATRAQPADFWLQGKFVLKSVQW